MEVRNALSAFFRVSTYSNAPAIESAGAAIDQFRMARAGVTYLDGGWRSIVDALSGLARKDGAVIEEQRKIVALLPGGPGWRAVLDDGTTHDAPAVILALSPADATRLLDPAPPALAAAAVRLRPVSAASLDLGLNSLPNRKGNFALGFDQPTYLSAHSLAARLGPPRAALVTVARYLGTENPPADETLTMLEATMGLVHPGWRDFVVEHRYLPHLTVTHAIVTADGGGLAGRPGPAVPGAPGLYIAGDWVGGEGMLADAAFASGRLAASLAAQALREPGAIRIHAAPRAR